jgi:hypothetical protein
MKLPSTEIEMSKKRNKELTLGDFTITGTSNPYTAARVLHRLPAVKSPWFQEARSRIIGKTIIIKPTTK